MRIEDDNQVTRISFLYGNKQYGLVAVMKNQLDEVRTCIEGLMGKGGGLRYNILRGTLCVTLVWFDICVQQ